MYQSPHACELPLLSKNCETWLRREVAALEPLNCCGCKLLTSECFCKINLDWPLEAGFLSGVMVLMDLGSSISEWNRHHAVLLGHSKINPTTLPGKSQVVWSLVKTQGASLTLPWVRSGFYCLRGLISSPSCGYELTSFESSDSPR